MFSLTKSAIRRPFHYITPRRSFLTVVQQGMTAYRLKFGRNPTKLEPGLHLRLPVIHKVIPVDLKEQSERIHKILAYSSDNVPVTLDGTLFFSVKDPYAATFAVDDYNNSVIQVGSSAMRAVIGTFQYDTIIADRNQLNDRLCQVIGDSIDQWGVACTRFEIQEFKPSSEAVERQLELQMEGERARRRTLLDTEASVNVADGLKRSSILKSEGQLASIRNEIAGEYENTIRKAEAKQTSMVLEAIGVAEQIEKISNALSGDPVTARYAALAMLLESKRINYLGDIARGPNNNTYFLDKLKPSADQQQLAYQDVFLKQSSQMKQQ